MKKLFIAFVLMITTSSSFAHYLWVDTAGKGTIGKAQEVKVHFGEYTYGVIEEVKGEAFNNVSKFKLWLIHPDGKKEELKTVAKEKFYLASFTPEKKGIYTLALNNNEIGVIDYTQYDFGIFKTHYHATAKVNVGDVEKQTETVNPDGIAIKELPANKGELKLQVSYKGQPLAKNEVTIFISDLWSKALETDGDGIVTLELPWNTKYLVETTMKEEVPGTYQGKDYEFIWHCGTYCVNKG
ncbi:DUF4198 domain-containing protein [Euzebyella marina]|uniref:DUF4198 domain-containing protein n=1 Tax=Euzebyella marina TaxID=1761453 RepID=A0A3G2L9J2_9FLAO|nr:DUF4198 domain-containing protein [Euzebyella marina]AYN68883.1 DUF4198 domain-containing protein [Euzebyella marina]